MPLNLVSPAQDIVGNHGEVINTAPLPVQTSVSPAQAVPGVGGIAGVATLQTLLTILGEEGLLVNTVGLPGTPTVAAAAGDGTTPPAPTLVAGSTDLAGTISFGSGATTAPGSILTVTFGNATLFSAAPRVFVEVTGSTGTLAATAAAVYVATKSATGFTVGCTGTLTASQANGAFFLDYFVTL